VPNLASHEDLHRDRSSLSCADHVNLHESPPLLCRTRARCPRGRPLVLSTRNRHLPSPRTFRPIRQTKGCRNERGLGARRLSGSRKGWTGFANNITGIGLVQVCSIRLCLLLFLQMHCPRLAHGTGFSSECYLRVILSDYHITCLFIFILYILVDTV